MLMYSLILMPAHDLPSRFFYNSTLDVYLILIESLVNTECDYADIVILSYE